MKTGLNFVEAPKVKSGLLTFDKIIKEEGIYKPHGIDDGWRAVVSKNIYGELFVVSIHRHGLFHPKDSTVHRWQGFYEKTNEKLSISIIEE